MPEDELPKGVGRHSLEHLLFITLTVTIDYQRDAPVLWKASWEAFQDESTRYLFQPDQLHAKGLRQATLDMKQKGLSRKTHKDPYLWYTVAVTLLKKWNGDPRRFLESCGHHAPTVMRRLAEDAHEERGRMVPDFPYLRGPKISRVWIRMLRDNLDIELTGLEEVPIPVDVHILRATICSGVLRGRYEGPANPVYEEVRGVWKEAVRDLQRPDGKPMIALDMDEPLWTLSKYGCIHRQTSGRDACPKDCPIVRGCPSGKIRVTGSECEVST